MNTIIEFALLFISFIFVIFMLFLAFYGIVLRTRKTRKQNIINYVLEQSKQWSADYDAVRKYSLEELHSPIKMYNTGVGNDASDLKVTDYTINTQWLIKI